MAIAAPRIRVWVPPADMLLVHSDGTSNAVSESNVALSDEDRLFIRAPLRVPTAATISAGYLSVLAGGVWAAKGINVAAIPRETAWTAAALWAAAPLYEEQFLGTAAAAGAVVEFDPTLAIQAAKGQGTYTPDGKSIFRLAAADGQTALLKPYDAAAGNFVRVGATFAGWTPEADPYTKMMRALWALLEAEPLFALHVPVGNRIDFCGDARRPMKDVISDADLPEVRIVPTQSTPGLPNTSETANDVLRLEIQIASGEGRLHAKHFPIRFAILKALAWDLVRERLSLLTWRGLPFVSSVRPVTISEGMDGSVFARSRKDESAGGIESWSSVWAIDCDIWLPVSELQTVGS